MSLADRPVFWLASSGLFAANGALSASQGRWALAALQAGTGVLALLAASSAAGVGRGPSADDGTGGAPWTPPFPEG